MAEGDILGILDTFTFDAVSGAYPALLKISDTVCAIAYGGPDGDGWLCTVKINADGSIDNAVIDSLEFDAAAGKRPTMVHVIGDIYAITYVGPAANGTICTVTISSAGAIADTVIDSYLWSTSQVYYPHMIKLSDAYYLIADRRADATAYLESIQIDVAGNITDPYTARQEYAAFGTADPRILKISPTVIASVYQDIDSDAWLITWAVSELGAIAAAGIAAYEFDEAYGANPGILHIAGNVYLIAYTGTGQSGFLITVTITQAGAITAGLIDSFEFVPLTAYTPRMLHVSGNVFMVAYTDANNDLYVSTVTVDTAGQITEPLIGSLELDAVDGQFPEIVFMQGNIYAIAYQGTAAAGKILTVEIETRPATAQADHLTMLGMG